MVVRVPKLEVGQIEKADFRVCPGDAKPMRANQSEERVWKNMPA
jgi:hypothetical protein